MTLSFVAYDAYRSTTDEVSYVELHRAANVVPYAPRFVFGGCSANLCNMMFTGGLTSAVGYYVVRNAMVARDNIVLHGETVLTGESTNHPEYYCRAVLGSDLPQVTNPGEPVKGTVVSLAGPGWNTWGHWLVDFLPRLYIFRRLGWALDDLKWLIPAEAPAYAFEFMQRLGVPADSILSYDSAGGLLKVSELLVPQNMTAGNVMHPLYVDAVAWMTSTIARSGVIPQSASKRIFVGRRSNPVWRELLNRTEIEDLAASFGYSIVEPSRLTVLEQIGMFAGATHIAGEYGSGLHNSIFAPRGAVVTCFRGNGPAAGVLQNGLVQCLGQHLGYVIGANIPGHPQEAFAVEMADAVKGLEFAERLSA